MPFYSSVDNIQCIIVIKIFIKKQFLWWIIQNLFFFFYIIWFSAIFFMIFISEFWSTCFYWDVLFFFFLLMKTWCFPWLSNRCLWKRILKENTYLMTWLVLQTYLFFFLIDYHFIKNRVVCLVFIYYFCNLLKIIYL